MPLTQTLRQLIGEVFSLGTFLSLLIILLNFIPGSLFRLIITFLQSSAKSLRSRYCSEDWSPIAIADYAEKSTFVAFDN